MLPENFIAKHIFTALVAEGFSEVVARGGGRYTAWIITGIARKQAGRGRSSMIVSFVRVSGPLDKPRQRNGNQQRKSREEVVALLPACSDFAMRFNSNLPGGVNS